MKTQQSHVDESGPNYFMIGGPSIKGKESTQGQFDDVQSFGAQCMAYSSMQEGMKEFRHPLYKGFIPYMTVCGIDYVLSDPITPEKDMIGLTHLFLVDHKDAVFCQISEQFARKLHHLNFKVNAFGVENVIDLKSFEVTWKKKKCLKSYLSKLSKQGYYVFEHAPAIKPVLQISHEWLQSKSKGKELQFMARPFAGILEPDVRYFYLYSRKKLVGFCSFDPIYVPDQSGTIVSYTLQHLRVLDEAPLGSQDFLILHALRYFKEEGIKKASLGVAPLYKRENLEFKHSALAEGIFKFVYNFNYSYNFKTIGRHKDHYKADQKQTYMATQKEFTLRKLYGLMKINNLLN